MALERVDIDDTIDDVVEVVVVDGGATVAQNIVKRLPWRQNGFGYVAR